MSKRNKLLDFILLVLKIFLPVVMFGFLVFFTYRLAEGHMEDLTNINDPYYHSGTGLYTFLSHLVLLCVNGISMVFGGIGLFISCKYKTSPVQNKNKLTFKWLTAAPVINQILYAIINLIVLNIG